VTDSSLPSQYPTVDVNVADPSGWPVTLGIPFAAGALHDAGTLGLTNPEGSAVPVSARQLVAWPDGSIRWALLAFQAKTTGPHAVTNNGNSEPENAVRLQETPDGITLDNGLVRVALARTGPGPISSLTAHGRLLLSDARELELRANDATTQYETAREITILESNAQRARIRIEGAHFTATGKRCLSYRLDVELWAGWSSLRLDYSFFNLETGSHELAIDSIQFAFRPQLKSDVQRHFVQSHYGDFMQPREVLNPAPVAIIADKSRVRPRIEEYAMLLDDSVYAPYLVPSVPDTESWLGLRDGEQSVYLQMHDFEAMPPGRLASRGNELLLEVWPAAAGPLQLPQGRSRRQCITLAFPAENNAGAGEIQKLLNAPLHEGRAVATSESFRSVAAFEQDLVLETNRNTRFERFLTRLIRMQTAHDKFDIGDTIEDGYTSGYLKLGRLPLKHGVTEPGNPMRVKSQHGTELAGDDRFEPAWSNNEYDVIHVLCSELMRDTKQELWRTLYLFTRHNIEVDFVYYSDDPWQHEGSPAHSSNHNFSSSYPSHIWTQGLLEYYCLTGDPDALEVAIKLGDTIIRNFNDPGRRPLLWGFNREIGWPILALVHLSDITGEARFREQVDEFVEYLMNFDRAGNKKAVNLSGVNPRHSMDRQIVGSYFGYASMVEGLQLYARLYNHEPLRAWLVDFLMSLKNALWQAGESSEGASSHLIAQGMAIGYELTGDEEFLRAGMLMIEQLMDSTTWLHPITAAKGVAVNYRAYIRFLHHAQDNGLLGGFDYLARRPGSLDVFRAGGG